MMFSIYMHRCRLTKQIPLKCYRPACERPVFSRKNINDRLSFCKRYKNWTVDDWRNVIFSNESTFKQFCIIQHHVRRPDGKRYDPKYSSIAVKHFPSVMVWGAISSTGHCGIFLSKDEKINAKKYLEIIQEKVPQLMVIKNVTFTTPHSDQITQYNEGFAHLDFSMFTYVFFATEFENHIRYDVTLIVFYLYLISYFLDISANFLYLVCGINLF